KDTLRLRIDPADRTGMLVIHAVDIRQTDGVGIYHWTPYSRQDVELNGVIFLNAGRALPDPVTFLLHADPSMIFPLTGRAEEYGAGVILEVELSALSPPAAAAVMGHVEGLCSLISNQ
ncbi:MAG TPA: hypothetical protein VGR89_11240, partial [Puia sp.]|nr:hypothetical protein [Puia sp.]